MNSRLIVSRRASVHIKAAAGWWAENRPKAPGLFADEIERGFLLARQLPNLGQPIRHPRVKGLRKLLLDRIHYFLY